MSSLSAGLFHPGLLIEKPPASVFAKLKANEFKFLFVLSPEGPDRVVTRMGVRPQHPRRYALIARFLNAPAAIVCFFARAKKSDNP